MRKPSLLLVVAVGVLTVGAAGCASLNRYLKSAFREPRLAFKTARIADASLGGATVDLVFQLDNPNPLSLSVAEVRYAFFVEGKQLVAGSPAKGVSIPASGKTDLSFPAQVKFADLGGVLQTFLTKDVASYRAEGTLGVQTPLGILRLPLVKEGTFEVPKVPQVELSNPRVKGLTLTGATVEIPLRVTNRNSFDLPVGGVNGALKIGNASIGQLATGDLGSLPARGTREVTLPLTLQFAQVGSAALSISQSKSTTVGFSGALVSGGASIPLNFSQVVQFSR